MIDYGEEYWDVLDEWNEWGEEGEEEEEEEEGALAGGDDDDETVDVVGDASTTPVQRKPIDVPIHLPAGHSAKESTFRIQIKK